MRIGQHSSCVIAHRVKVSSKGLVVSRYCLLSRVITEVDAIVCMQTSNHARNRFCGVLTCRVGPIKQKRVFRNGIERGIVSRWWPANPHRSYRNQSSVTSSTFGVASAIQSAVSRVSISHFPSVYYVSKGGEFVRDTLEKYETHPELYTRSSV